MVEIIVQFKIINFHRIQLIVALLQYPRRHAHMFSSLCNCFQVIWCSERSCSARETSCDSPGITLEWSCTILCECECVYKRERERVCEREWERVSEWVRESEREWVHVHVCGCIRELIIVLCACAGGRDSKFFWNRKVWAGTPWNIPATPLTPLNRGPCCEIHCWLQLDWGPLVTPSAAQLKEWCRYHI